MGSRFDLSVRVTVAAVVAFATAPLMFAPTTFAQTPDRTNLPMAPPPFRGEITRDYRTSMQQPVEPWGAPKGSPNVLLILLDEAGYGQTGTFGGIIPTPTLDGLAKDGLRYTRFHVTALCSPTRAALMTGRNHHAVGMGTITNWANGYPGYTGSIPKSAAFVSEILRENGYATAAFGKWHLIPDAETTLAGPYDHWPTHQGYDYYYGFIGADTDQWHPELTEGTKPIEMVAPPGREKDYTLNEDLATHACAWIEQQKALAPDRPVFIYYATGATHAPLEAPEAWIDRFKGKFDMGWDKYREMVLERQKRLGVVPQDTVLTPRPAELPAWAGNTPFQWGKRIGSHLGGTRDPLVVAWRGHIKDPGGVRSQYQDVTDIFPTILEAARVPEPKSVDGVAQQPVNGVSFFASFENPQAPGRETQYFEMHGNRAMYDHGWIAAQRTGLLPWAYTFTNNNGPLPWELYDLEKDYSEANNLAAKYPDKLAQLQKLFDEEAWKNHVYPIDPRIAGRQHPNPPPPGGRAFYTFYPGATHLYDALAPGTRNRTHTFTAYVTIPPGGADGVLVAEGGEAAGYSLYIKDGHPAYTYNYFRQNITTITSPEKLPEGHSVIELHFAYDGGGLGKGATVTLMVNGKKDGEARLEKTVPRAYSFEETFDVGEDTASPVGPYRTPFPFTGTLEKLELRSGPLPQLSESQQKVEEQYAERVAALKD